MSDSRTVMIRCDATQKERQTKLSRKGTPKLPRGWKRIAGKTYCPEAYKDRFVVRALKVPVMWPENKEDRDALANAIRKGQRELREIANHTLSALYTHDLQTSQFDEEGKLSKFEIPYLYPILRERLPSVTPDLVVLMTNRVTLTYLKDRWDVRVGRKSLPNYRQLPLFIRASENNKWAIVDGKPKFTVTLIKGYRTTLTINQTSRAGANEKRRRNHNRNWHALVKTIEEGMPIGECQLTIDKRGNIMLTAIVTIPKQLRERDGTLHIKTDKDSLLLAFNDKDHKLWDYHRDDLIRRQAAHKARLQRWSDDSKYEDRPNPAFSNRRSCAVRKHRNWLNTVVEQASARVANYANRRGIKKVIFTEGEKLTDQFDWHKLKTRIEQKCDAYGIDFEVVQAETCDST